MDSSNPVQDQSPTSPGPPPISRRGLLAASAALGLSACARSIPAAPIPYVDGLSFLPQDLSDIGRAGLHAFICDVAEEMEVKDPDGLVRYVRTFDLCNRSLDAATARLAQSPSAYVGKRGSDIGKRQGAAIFLQFQSCEPIEDDLGRIAYFHGKGLRLLQITHHNNNLFGGGAIERVPSGLTKLGVEGVAEMNRVGIIPDVSHASEATALDVGRITRTPFVLSHGACEAIVNHPRCASDAVIRSIADKGGVMGIFMMSFWLTRDPVPGIAHLLAQFRHVIKVGGIESVGIANDFDMAGHQRLAALANDNAEGVKDYHDWWRANHRRGVAGFEELPRHVVIPELNRIDRMKIIHASLDRAGFKSGAIEKIMGGNWIRVLEEVLG